MEKENAQSRDAILSAAMQNIMRFSEDFVFVKDTDLIYRDCSESFSRLNGLTGTDALVGKNDFDLYPKETAEKYRAADRQVMESGQPIIGVVEKMPESGGFLWTLMSKYPLFDKSGSIIGVYGISRDVTQVVGLESEAKAARKYTDLISRLPGGVSILHTDRGRFQIDYVNDGWFAVHHFSREYGEQMLRGDPMACVCQADREHIWQEYMCVENQSALERGVTYQILGEDREPHWINMRFRYAYTENGIRYCYASYSDLDEQKQAEKSLAESRRALSEAISNSDIQFFTYFPESHRAEIYAVNDRLAELPVVWNDFPDDFLAYTQASKEDAEAYREMIRAIDRGQDEAECTVRFAYMGSYTWEKLRIRAVRDANGKTVKGQGYSLNVSARRLAEDRLQKERVRLKSLEGGVFEAFSFNITKGSQPNIQTADDAMLRLPLTDDMLREAVRICPPLQDSNPATREILLRAAARIPDDDERARFISTFSGDTVRRAVIKGQYAGRLRYRRYIGDVLCWVETNAEVLPDPETGNLIAFFYTSDVSREVLLEKLSARIIEKNYECVSIWDLHTDCFTVVSGTDPALLALDGHRYSEVIEGAAAGYVDPADAQSYRSSLAPETVLAQLADGQSYSVYNLRRETLSALPGCPHRRMKNDVFYLDEHRDLVVFLLSDVTEIFEQERENREKLAHALAAAEQASVAKTEFLSRMSHEIRTPMNAIIGLDAIALQEKDLSVSMEDHLQKIGISARFLLSLINDILDMSRIESGRMILKNEPFNFEELINGINTILYEQCRDSGLDYDCVLKSYTEETYVGDETKLQQVLVNILGNAVKFTPRGGKVHFMIEQLSRTKNRAKLRFEISDTGIGIDEKFLPQLFEPFSQENRGRTSAYGGTGLGLAISKNIVSLMGGDITVHSIKNVGSNFTVDVELGLAEETIRRRAILDSQLFPLYTLIVDDDVIICRHTQMILNEAGLDTEWIDSGAGAVEKVSEQHKKRRDYDLILLDWKMPDMDGIETARQIRKIVGPDVTIIIMTAYDWTDIEKKARAAGVDMFMKKPIFASSVTKAFENVFLRKGSDLGREQPPKPVFDFTGKHVLLAEDNEINAEIARNILEMKGCTVDHACNGAEAVESFAAASPGHYDAILMDVRMPVMDGLDAARTVRAMRKADSKTIPIIAMTANAFAEDVTQSLEAGMNAHLAKPIEPQMLYETLERYFKKGVEG